MLSIAQPRSAGTTGGKPTDLIYRVLRPGGEVAWSAYHRNKSATNRRLMIGEYQANTRYGNRVSVGVARLQVFAAALLFSTGGAGIKAAAFTGLQVSALRSAMPLSILIVFLRGKLVLSPPMLATGIVYAATVTLFVLSTKLTTAANAIFLQATAPLYLLLLGPVVLVERFRRRDVAFLVAVAVGLAFCVIGRPSPTTTRTDPGDREPAGRDLQHHVGVHAARAALRAARPRGDERRACQPWRSGTFSPALQPGRLRGRFPRRVQSEWATIVYLGVCQMALAYVFLTAAMRVLPALEVSLLLLIEPVLNPTWTWLIRGEDPGGYTIAGGAIIIAATAIKSVYDARMSAGAAAEVTKTV